MTHIASTEDKGHKATKAKAKEQTKKEFPVTMVWTPNAGYAFSHSNVEKTCIESHATMYSTRSATSLT